MECRTPDEKMDRYNRTIETGKKVAGIVERTGKWVLPGIFLKKRNLWGYDCSHD
jgi:hypothetical protein